MSQSVENYLINRILTHLTPDEMTVLRTAAVFPQPFRWGDVTVATELDPDQARNAQENLTHLRLIDPAGMGEFSLHRTIGHAVLRQTPPDERQRLTDAVQNVLKLHESTPTHPDFYLTSLSRRPLSPADIR